MAKINLDKINNAQPADVAKSNFVVIDRLQSFEPHIQVLGLAATFLILAERFGVDAQTIFTVTKNLMNSKEGLRPEFVAVKDYVENEIKNPA